MVLIRVHRLDHVADLLRRQTTYGRVGLVRVVGWNEGTSGKDEGEGEDEGLRGGGVAGWRGGRRRGGAAARSLDESMLP